MTSISRDEWLKALNEAGVPTDSDDDAITAAEFSVMCGGIPLATARERLSRLVDHGKAIRTSKRIRDARGHMVMCIAFKLVT